MAFQRFDKDPDANLDYVIDWADWLDGDTITDATITSENAVDDPGDITIEDFDFTTTTTTAWLSGGTLSHSYLLTIHVTTAQDREEDRSFLVVIGQR